METLSFIYGACAVIVLAFVVTAILYMRLVSQQQKTIKHMIEEITHLRNSLYSELEVLRRDLNTEVSDIHGRLNKHCTPESVKKPILKG